MVKKFTIRPNGIDLKHCDDEHHPYETLEHQHIENLLCCCLLHLRPTLHHCASYTRDLQFGYTIRPSYVATSYAQHPPSTIYASYAKDTWFSYPHSNVQGSLFTATRLVGSVDMLVVLKFIEMNGQGDEAHPGFGNGYLQATLVELFLFVSVGKDNQGTQRLEATKISNLYQVLVTKFHVFYGLHIRGRGTFG